MPARYGATPNSKETGDLRHWWWRGLRDPMLSAPTSLEDVENALVALSKERVRASRLSESVQANRDAVGTP